MGWTNVDLDNSLSVKNLLPIVRQLLHYCLSLKLFPEIRPRTNLDLTHREATFPLASVQAERFIEGEVPLDPDLDAHLRAIFGAL